MNALLLAATLFAFVGTEAQTVPKPTVPATGTPQYVVTGTVAVAEAGTKPATQLYVKTIPSGAEIKVDGRKIGKSDGLFHVAAGEHKLTLSMEDYVADERSVKVVEGEITRVEATLKTRSDRQTVLGYVGDANDDMRSFADSGFAVAFQRPADMKSISAVKIFAARYGYDEPPNEDFHVYLLDQDKKVLEQASIPYRKIEKGDLRWYTLEIPAVQVPEKFFVALWFNAESTKGVYMGMKKNGKEKHSYVGLPDKGYKEVDKPYDWMIRAVVSSENGKKPTCPKVTTYEEEKAADTETTEALPSRIWNDATGAFSVEAQFAGLEQGKVMLKKANGKIVAVPLEQLSKEDRDFVANQTGAKQVAAVSQQPQPDSIVEGVGWKEARVGISREELINSLGKPENDPSSDWLKWPGKHIDCTFHTGSLVVSEVRFNPGFEGALANGVKLSSSGSEMLKLYGEPEHAVDRGNGARKYEYSQKGILFWTYQGSITQIVVFKPYSPAINTSGKQQARARERMQRDARTFSAQELQEIESLYQVANQKWQTPEARDGLKMLVEKYKKANRTGCAILYLGQMSPGQEQIAYFKQAIADHSDCFYGDGVQVGAFARFLLGQTYLKSGKAELAEAMFDEIRKNYPDSVDHQGNSLVGQVPQGKKRGSPTNAAAKSGIGEASELSHDNGTMASKMSIGGGGAAVKFKADGDSCYVTSVSLHGSRYGEARPPKENFKVWICDAQFKPIATFEFPYSSYTRENKVWKNFRIRPTRVPENFIVCFGFNAHQTKGVYVSYDDKPSETSMTGVPDKGQPKPFTKGNWLIRCKVEKRTESGTKVQ